MPRNRRAGDVFVNCPFTPDFEKLFHAILFVIQDCGLRPRTTLEFGGSGIARIDNICRLIADCRYGIHDISAVELDRKHKLPRFNMPLELGLFLGAYEFGGRKHRSKRCLVMDRKPYRYMIFCSDISGRDIKAHGYTVQGVIRCVRNWLATELRTQLPGAKEIGLKYERFQRQLPHLCQATHQSVHGLTYVDRVQLVQGWLLNNPW